MTSPHPAEGRLAPAEAPVSAAPARRKRARLPLMLGVAVLLVLVGSGAAYTAVNLPRGCGIFGAARHDLPCDVPLPSGAAYARPFALPGGAPAGATERGWVFTVAHTSGRALHDFYAGQLAASGWACVKDSAAGFPADDVTYAAPQSFAASKDSRGLVVAYRGDTGEVSVVVDDFHAALGPC